MNISRILSLFSFSSALLSNLSITSLNYTLVYICSCLFYFSVSIFTVLATQSSTFSTELLTYPCILAISVWHPATCLMRDSISLLNTTISSLKLASAYDYRAWIFIIPVILLLLVAVIYALNYSNCYLYASIQVLCPSFSF